MWEDIWEIILEFLQNLCFHRIRKHVRSPFLRGMLYVLTVLVLTALFLTIVTAPFWGGYLVIVWVLDLLNAVLI